MTAAPEPDPIEPPLQAFDLEPLLNALLRRREKESRRAYFALKNLRDAQSAIYDLLFALETLEFLRAQAEENDLPPAVRGACFSQVILLYVRAAEASSERRSLQISSRLNPAQKELHDRLVKVRNKVIAHLDRDRSFGTKSFGDEKLVVVHAREGGQRIQLAERRLVEQTFLELDILELLYAALKLAQGELDERSSDAAKHLSELSKDDAKIGETIERHPFDAIDFFGDERVGRAFLERGVVGVDPDREILQFDHWPDPR